MGAGDFGKVTSLAQAIKFNGGGVFNHTFFWESLAPISVGGGTFPDPASDLALMVTNTWGSIDKFMTAFNAQTAAIQGSGWGWLCYNKSTKNLEFRWTANQDQVSDLDPNLVPIMTIDIWEHAYYLDYQNVRPNYLKEMWKIVNWKKMAERLDAARK